MLDFCLLSLSLAIPPWVGAMSTSDMATATIRVENGKFCIYRPTVDSLTRS